MKKKKKRVFKVPNIKKTTENGLWHINKIILYWNSFLPEKPLPCQRSDHMHGTLFCKCFTFVQDTIFSPNMLSIFHSLTPVFSVYIYSMQYFHAHIQHDIDLALLNKEWQIQWHAICHLLLTFLHAFTFLFSF